MYWPIMNLRALKVLVAAMGVMLVIGLAALVVTIAVRMSHRAPPPSASFTAPQILLPHGSAIDRMSVGSDRIVVEMALADGSAQLVVIDLASGRLLSVIPLKEAP
jgi:hypothetical protein